VLHTSFLPPLPKATELSVGASLYRWALALRKGVIPPPVPERSTRYNNSNVVKR
ncbi:unnamed protein product, partial [Bubo scandiacus]